VNGDAQAGDAKILDAAEEEDDREKLDKRIDAVNASSSTARNSWVFFLGLMAYLGVVTAGVTHKDLLLDNQIKLTALGELSLSVKAKTRSDSQRLDGRPGLSLCL
jgi:hypothetical protein